MGILRIQDLGKSFGIEELFHNVSFDVARGDKIGFVGPNGAGKSTLMKCLLGIEEYDTGRISIDSVDTIGYMQQQSDFTHDNLYDELLSAFADIIALGQKKTTLEKQIENLDDIQNRRKALWQQYYDGLKPLAEKGFFKLFPISVFRCRMKLIKMEKRG